MIYTIISSCFRLKYLAILILFVGITISCKDKNSNQNSEISKSVKSINSDSISEIKYAKCFTITNYEGYKIIEITNAWPGATKHFKYALVEENGKLPTDLEFDAVVKIPLKNIVVTSTTHIPSLEMLGVENTLIGFPNLDYISSEKTRKRISDKQIKELGRNEDINTEVLIELNPNLVVGYGIDNENTTFTTIAKTGIPVVYNADWTETTPLGKAEWLKFFGAFYGKEKLADSLFSKIEEDYNKSKKLALTATNKPTVLSGAMYKDVWYMPQGNSWGAQFIADANGDYLWKDSDGTGSLSLNVESVLEKGKTAEIWIGPGQFSSYSQLKEANQVYAEFDAFKNKKVFNFTNKKGETGGVLYYELAPNRPDLVLKDIIKAIHPELLLDYQPYFFSKLQ